MASIEGESEGYNRSMRHSDTSHMVDRAQRGDHNRPLDHGSCQHQQWTDCYKKVLKSRARPLSHFPTTHMIGFAVPYISDINICSDKPDRLCQHRKEGRISSAQWNITTHNIFTKKVGLNIGQRGCCDFQPQSAVVENKSSGETIAFLTQEELVIAPAACFDKEHSSQWDREQTDWQHFMGAVSLTNVKYFKDDTWTFYCEIQPIFGRSHFHFQLL